MVKVAQKIKMIKIKDIRPNPYQLRRTFNEKSLKNLSDSIKEVGLLSPITVRRNSFGYELICGQRRLRAASMAKLEEIPAIVVTAGDKECAELTLLENIHRKNLTVFEEAEGFYNLILYHKIKKEKLCKRISAELCDIHEKLRFLELKPAVRTKSEQINADKKLLKQLLRLKNEEKQLEILDNTEKGVLSMEETEKTVSKYIKEEASFNKHYHTKTDTKINKTPLFENTVRKTVEILKKYGAKVEFSKIEEKNHTEYIIKTLKQ